MMPLPHDHAVTIDDDGTHDGVGGGLSQPALGEPKRTLHVLFV
jgi:hypothetical protein